jgi:lactoylglutathione lyase
MSARVKALRHTGLVVRNLEKSLAFYEGVLGLRVVSENREDSAFLDTILGGENIALFTVKLAAPEGASLLELLHFPNLEPTAAGRRVEYFSPGPTHAAFTVGKAEAAHAAIVEAGGLCLSEPRLAPDGRAWVFFARDPEDNLLELVQPVEQAG